MARLSGNLFVNLKGQPLPRAPELTFSMAARLPVHAGSMGRLGAAGIYLQGLAVLHHRGRDLSADQRRDGIWRSAHADESDSAGAQPFRRLSVPHPGGGHRQPAGRRASETSAGEVVAYVENLTDEAYYTGTGENFGLSGFRLRPHPRILGRQGQLQVWPLDGRRRTLERGRRALCEGGTPSFPG